MTRKPKQVGEQKTTAAKELKEFLTGTPTSLFDPARRLTGQVNLQTRKDALRRIEQAREEFQREFHAERWNTFVERGGQLALDRLTEKNADQKFIISLLYYLWDPTVPTHDYEEKDKALAHINAVYVTRHLYLWFTNDDESTQRVIGRSLARMQRRMERQLREKDYDVPKTQYFETSSLMEPSIIPFIEPQKKKRSPDDKVNRVIFVILEHLKHKTKGPQWGDFLRVLAAAGAISVGSNDSPDRRIVPHIKSFEKHHPKEAELIKQKVQDPQLTVHTLFPLW